MKTNNLFYIKGKPIKFARYGGLSPVVQEGYTTTEITFHTPPKRKGIYCFTWPYIDLFLVGALEYSKTKYSFLKDKDGKRIDSKHPNFEKLAESRMYEPTGEKNESGYDSNWFLLERCKVKIFTYTGELWHHLGNRLKPDEIIQQKNSWTLSTYYNFCNALKREFHCMAREPLGIVKNDVIARWRYSNNPTVNYTKDHLEVFIERVK